MLLFLVRHALTPATGVRLAGWRPNIHLSDAGLAEARRLAQRMERIPLDAVYSSPLERAVETAKPMATARKLRIRIREGLGEVRYGRWEGRALRSLAKTRHWRTVLAHPSEARFPGGEALRETQARAVAAVGDIVAEHPRGSVAVVTHADVIKMVLAHYAGIHLDLYARLAIAPASVSVVAAGNGVPRILKVNDTGSLDELAPARR
ncbi:MAG: MSMEG_4193 family putative phosphomutase [Actinomycetota bacterium]